MPPIIQIEDLHIQLSGHEILKGISLEAMRGEYISIIGPNGAGKTTMIKCLAGIYRQWSGGIHIVGKPYASYRSRELARIQSYVPQAEGRSLPWTVEEFVTMGRYPHLSAFTTLKPADYKAVNSAIEQAGLTPLRQRAMNTLSGGERQMAFIAAALAQQTDILLLDEPSTFLDYRHQVGVTALLKKACRENGISVLAVHHDINTALACSDRLYALRGGQLVFNGAPDEIAKEEVLHRIYETDFQLIPSPHSPLPLISAGGRS